MDILFTVRNDSDLSIMRLIIHLQCGSMKSKPQIIWKQPHSVCITMKNKDLFIMKTRVLCYSCQIGTLQALTIKSMEKKHKTVKGGNFILRISVTIHLRLRRLGSIPFSIWIYWYLYFSPGNNEFLSLTARAVAVWGIWNT